MNPGAGSDRRDPEIDLDAALLARSGYNHCVPLRDGASGRIWSAVDADGEPVALKTPMSGIGLEESRRLFAKEFQVGRDVRHRNLAAYRRLDRVDGVPVIELSPLSGRPLAALLAEGQLPIRRALTIGVQLAEAAAHLHRCGVIHKLINPDNVLVDRADAPMGRSIDTAVLTDLSGASLLSSEFAPAVPPATFGPHLSYVAPEQTGRINARLDARADLYAIGATLFHLLTGRPPFEGRDELEIVHAHIARRAPDVVDLRPETPAAVAAVVAKLLTKNPDGRYHTADGLLHDLRWCRDASVHQTDTARFVPGRRDRSTRPTLPATLYGRRQARDDLTTAFERITVGSRLVLLTGPAGIGKSALINEMYRPVLAHKGRLVRGKFDQLDRSTPYRAVADAFAGLLEALLCEPDGIIADWRDRLLDALGAEGRVLFGLIPLLEQLIGPQPEVPALAGGAAERRLLRVFSALVEEICAGGRPLVVFIDDLQWADPASLRLLRSLLGAVDDLLVVGAYRNEEVGAGHPLRATLTDLEQDGVPVEHVRLAPLGPAEINELLVDTLRRSPDRTEPLARLLHLRTGGNPFFLTQLLTQLFEDGLLTRAVDGDGGDGPNDATGPDGSDADDELSLDEISAVALTGDVIEFMTRKLWAMPDETGAALRIGAALGDRFQLDEVAAVLDRPTGQVAAALWPAVNSGLLLPLDDGYKYYRGATRGAGPGPELGVVRSGYRFLHDRVQQAAYALGAEADRPAIHFRIGARLWDRRDDEDVVFDLARHLNRAIDHGGAAPASGVVGDAGPDPSYGSIDSDRWRARTRTANLEAGLKAAGSSAHDAAFRFLERGLDTVDARVWDEEHDSAMALCLHGAEAAFLTGRFDEAERRYELAGPRCRTVLEEARLVRLQVTQYQLQGRNEEAIAILADVLGRADVSIPTSDDEVEAAIDREVSTIFGFLDRHGIGALTTLPITDDQLTVECMRILQVLFYAAWRDGRTKLALLALCLMTSRSMDDGNSEMSPFAYVGFGLVSVVHLRDYPTAHDFGSVAVELCETLGDEDARGMANYIFASDVMGWRRPLRETMVHYDEALRQGLAADNLLTVGFMMQQSSMDQLAFGAELGDLVARAGHHAEHLDRIGNHDNLNALLVGTLQPARCLIGSGPAPGELDSDGFDEAAFLREYGDKPYYMAWYRMSRIRLAVYWQRTERYGELVDDVESVLSKLPSHANKIPATAMHAVVMHQTLARSRSGQARSAHIEAAQELEGCLAEWAEACPENVAHKYELAVAERLRTAGNPGAALDGYRRAADLARRNDYVNEEALANESAGRLLIEWDKPDLAVVHLDAAQTCYRRWGAVAKADAVADLRASVDPSPTDRADAVADDPAGNAAAVGGVGASLDLLSLLKLADSLAGITERRVLFERIATVIAENSGAETCALLRYQRGGPVLHALHQSETTELGGGELPRTVADHEVPVGLINYVRRVGASVSHDAVDGTGIDVEDDAYLNRIAPASALVAPIRAQGQILGVVYLEHRNSRGVFSSDSQVLSFLCAQAGIAMRNADLYAGMEEHSATLEQQVAKRTDELAEANRELLRLATTDPLTGLHNRRAFESHLSEQWQGAARNDRWLSIILVDVDHFKIFNDLNGHLAGDRCLARVAHTLAACVRGPNDLVARFGGEEFIVLLADTEREQAGRVAERLRSSVETLGIPRSPDGQQGVVTVSLGLESRRPVEGESSDDLIRFADKALYRAKDAGRNRWTAYA